MIKWAYDDRMATSNMIASHNLIPRKHDPRMMMQSFTNSTRWWIIIDDEENDDNCRLGWYENKEWQWSMINIKHGFVNENDRWVFYSIVIDMVDDNDENMLKKLMATEWGLMTMTINDRSLTKKSKKSMIIVDMIDDNVDRMIIVDSEIQWSLMKKSMAR